jgi:hypothetical protein
MFADRIHADVVTKCRNERPYSPTRAKDDVPFIKQLEGLLNVDIEDLTLAERKQNIISRVQQTMSYHSGGHEDLADVSLLSRPDSSSLSAHNGSISMDDSPKWVKRIRDEVRSELRDRGENRRPVEILLRVLEESERRKIKNKKELNLEISKLKQINSNLRNFIKQKESLDLTCEPTAMEPGSSSRSSAPQVKSKDSSRKNSLNIFHFDELSKSLDDDLQTENLRSFSNRTILKF